MNLLMSVIKFYPTHKTAGLSLWQCFSICFRRTKEYHGTLGLSD